MSLYDALLLVEDDNLNGEEVDVWAVEQWEPWDDYSRTYTRAVSTVWLGQRGLVIGRSRQLAPPCLRFKDGSVSRRHVEVRFNGSDYTVRDVGSTGGIGLNHTPVANDEQPHRLEPGDYFFAGGWTDRRLTYFDSRAPHRAPDFVQDLFESRRRGCPAAPTR